MATFEQGDVIRVPFPYTDRDTRQRRPALVVSASPLGETGALLWVAMITSADNRSWPRDIAIPNHERCGLPAPSIIRIDKLATIETRHAEHIGAIHQKTLTNVLMLMHAIIAGPN